VCLNEKEIGCVRARERERTRERMCACVWMSERGGGLMFACAHEHMLTCHTCVHWVCAREREREGGREGGGVCVCVREIACVHRRVCERQTHLIIIVVVSAPCDFLVGGEEIIRFFLNLPC